MKNFFLSPGVRCGRPARTLAAFTLPEMMISITILALVVTGVVAANLFGLRMFQITENKLNAGDAARKVIGRMTDEIRTCKTTWVGDVSNGVFVARATGQAQTGTGLMICPTTNSTNFILYFLNPSDQSFRRTTSVAGTTTVVAQPITNSLLFSAQDYLGNVLTNNQNNRVIHLSVEFYQAPRFGVVADSYKLETSVTRRTLD